MCSRASVKHQNSEDGREVADRSVGERLEAVVEDVLREGDVERPEEDGSRGASGRRSSLGARMFTLPLDFRAMAEPTRDDVDALVGPATPHFACQLRAVCASSSPELPDDHRCAPYAEGQMELSTTRATPGPRRTRAPASRTTRLGWETIPRRSARRDAPLPPAARERLRHRWVARIGRAIALRLARDGAERVAIGYLRNDRAAEEAAAELRRQARSRCSCAATSPRHASSTKWPRSGLSTCSSTTRPPASFARRSTPRTSTGTGR